MQEDMLCPGNEEIIRGYANGLASSLKAVEIVMDDVFSDENIPEGIKHEVGFFLGSAFMLIERERLGALKAIHEAGDLDEEEAEAFKIDAATYHYYSDCPDMELPTEPELWTALKEDKR